MKIKCSITLLLFIGLAMNQVDCQLKISGPVCVLTGNEYQYNISGKLDSSTHLCVTGGTLSGTDSSCSMALTAGYVKIVWTELSGSIICSSLTDTTLLYIQTTFQLDGGLIDSTVNTQSIAYQTIPSSIICSEASGGNCQPSYSYQWEQSEDNLVWKEISSALDKDLNFSVPLTRSQFFRRKTTENNSHTIIYSSEAVVYVDVDSSGH
jgi:hypothetical protein